MVRTNLWLSGFNLALAGVLLLAVALLGPTSFIFDTFTTSLGSYLDNLVQMSLRMSPFSANTWVADWTIFYWAWWISWSPFVGAFIARVSYGRTVREFVLGVVVLPSLLGFVWFAVFGGTALWEQIFGGVDMAGALAAGHETVLFPHVRCPAGVRAAVGPEHPAAGDLLRDLGRFRSVGAGFDVERVRRGPAAGAQVRLGIAIALIAVAMLIAGGLHALQTLITVAALPFALLMVAVMIGLYRVLSLEALREKAEERRARRAIEDWIAREQDQQAPEQTGDAADGSRGSRRPAALTRIVRRSGEPASRSSGCLWRSANPHGLTLTSIGLAPASRVDPLMSNVNQ